MTSGKCRACGGTLKGPRPLDARAQAAEVLIVARLPGKRRMGDFALCPLCVWHTVTGPQDSNVAVSLVAELKALLR